jgi:hypothetical protein
MSIQAAIVFFDPCSSIELLRHSRRIQVLLLKPKLKVRLHPFDPSYRANLFDQARGRPDQRPYAGFAAVRQLARIDVGYHGDGIERGYSTAPPIGSKLNPCSPAIHRSRRFSSV